MSLKAIQKVFIKQLNGNHPADDFLGYLKPCGKLFPDQQLAIYQNNVSSALQKTLIQIYPVCCKILGENYFKQISRGYIADYPSENHDLNLYGENFSVYIHSQSEHRSELFDFPYLGDLSQLEWLYHQAYYAAQAPVFNFAKFAQLTEEQYARITFQLAPYLHFMSSDFPVVSIWQENQTQSDSQQIIPADAEYACIHREDFRIEIYRIEIEDFDLLNSIASGTILETILEMDTSHRLTAFIKSGWICGFKLAHV